MSRGPKSENWDHRTECLLLLQMAMWTQRLKVWQNEAGSYPLTHNIREGNLGPSHCDGSWQPGFHVRRMSCSVDGPLVVVVVDGLQVQTGKLLSNNH